VSLLTPDRKRTLAQDLSLAIAHGGGKGLLIVGESGSGKSSILRAIAGLWNKGAGVITHPELKEMLFLPQRPYMILGSLRNQLLYPGNADVSDEELHAVLKKVNLADLPEALGGLNAEMDWTSVLSLGEQQRLIFARLLLAKPRYAILDEATSALDEANEERLYQLLAETATTYVSVGHRKSLVAYHDNVLELNCDSTWRLVPAEEYLQSPVALQHASVEVAAAL
jgi:putative ATP-binding cassette transporter